jgi:hypothetical protein
MKKLLSLLCVLATSGTVMPLIVAVAPYQIKEIKLKNNINYQQTNNLEILKRNKRQNDDEFEKSIYINNVIGEVKEKKLFLKIFKCFFIKLTPIFWREIINLYNSSHNEDDFSKRFSNKIKEEFPNFIKNKKNINLRKEIGIISNTKKYSLNFYKLGCMLYNNFQNINYKWERSNKTKRIRILFKIQPFEILKFIVGLEEEEGEYEYLQEVIKHNSSFEQTELDIYYVASNIEDDNDDENEQIYVWRNYDDNNIINTLKNDFKDFNKNSIKLDIIDNDDDKSILDVLKKQNPKLKISELDVFEKKSYSHFLKSSSAKIKIKIDSKSDYPKIILKPILYFISKTTLKKLEDKIRNDSMYKKWDNHLKDYLDNLPKKIKIINSSNEYQKWIYRNHEKEILKQYIRDFDGIKRIIEIEWKIQELNTNIIKEIQEIKNDLNDLKNILQNIEKEIFEINNPNSSFSLSASDSFSLFSIFLDKIADKVNLPGFLLIYEISKNIFSILLANIKINDDFLESKYDFLNKRENINFLIEKFNNLDINNKINTWSSKNVEFLLNSNIYDVPADNSCLFWTVATAYLLPVKNNNEEFRKRFIQLFGEQELQNLSNLQTLLQQYDLEDNRNLNQLWYQNQIVNNLVTTVFRNRVVDYIQSNLNMITNRGSELTFRNLIQENNVNASNYLERMRQSSTWGGTPEILAMSNLLNANISVNNHASYQPINQNSNNTINIFHVNGNHYNFASSNQTPQTDKEYQRSVGGGCLNEEDNDIENHNLFLNKPQLKNNEYHFIDPETEQKSLKNDENLNIYLIKNQNQMINKYNSLSKAEKQQKLNEINQHYQTLPENEQKSFKDKLKAIGSAAIGAGISAVGSKITVGGYASTTIGTTGETIEMTPLLSEGGLAAAETLSVAEGTAIVTTEGAVIGAEAGAATALAPETLGLSLVIGGLAIAGTAIIWWLSHDNNNVEAVKHESHNQYNEIEKYYQFLAHDQLKLDINISEWDKIKQIYQENANNYQEFKNKIKSEITNFKKEDHSGWGGSITDEDINTLIKIIYNHFQEINNYFSFNPNHGWKIITDTGGSYFIIEEE